jgi:glucokinase
LCCSTAQLRRFALQKLAIDIGGTKIATGMVDAQGRVTHRREVPTMADNAENIIQRAVAACDQTLQTYKPSTFSIQTSPTSPTSPTSIGISTGGDVNFAQGRIAYATPLLPGWAGLNLRQIFEREFGLPTYIDNDGNCSALAEVVFGAAQGCSHALTLIVGTGIGAGFVANGKVMRGAFGGALNPGQIWLDEHNTYENLIASGALAKRFGQPIQHIAAHAALQDQLPAPLQAAAQHLGRLAATCAAILDPNCIVIAGSILLLGDRFLQAAQTSFQRYARPPHQPLVLRPSTLDADSALIGASLLDEDAQDGKFSLGFTCE